MKGGVRRDLQAVRPPQDSGDPREFLQLADHLDPLQIMETVGSELKQLGVTLLIARFEQGSQNLVVRYTSIPPSALDRATGLLGVRLIGFPVPEAIWPVDRLVEQRRPLFMRDPFFYLATGLPNLPDEDIEAIMDIAGANRTTGVIYLPLVMLPMGAHLRQLFFVDGLFVMHRLESGIAQNRLLQPFQPEELAARMGILLRRSEALKAVSNLEANSKKTATVVAVHSLRGGVGCTSFAVNLAIAFQQLWLKSTLVVDGVLTAGQVALMMDAAPRVTWADFAGLKPEHVDVDSITKLCQLHASGVKFIASPPSPMAADSFIDGFWPKILDTLTEFNNFIILDTAHDLSNVTIHMLDAASNIILVISPEMASLHSAVCALDIYAKLGMRSERIFIVVNQTFDQFVPKQTQIEKVIHRMGNLEYIYLTGDFARGIDSPVIELILVGADIDRQYLSRKVAQAEELCGRKVSFVVLEPSESALYLGKLNAALLPLWNNGVTQPSKLTRRLADQ